MAVSEARRWNAPDRRPMIASGIATMSEWIALFAVAPNSAGRTSSAERRVDITRPAPRGSTRTGRSRHEIVTLPSPTSLLWAICLPDDPECHRRQLAVGVDVIGRVEIDRADFVAVHKAVEIDYLKAVEIDYLKDAIFRSFSSSSSSGQQAREQRPKMADFDDDSAS
jgi:hypothetical protein